MAHSDWLDHAKELLAQSNCLRRKYAAVIVKDGRVAGEGFNHAATQCVTCARQGAHHNVGDYSECKSLHAEQMALLDANVRGRQLRGAVLYLVCDQDDNPTPCPICQRMLDWAGVTMYRAGDVKPAAPVDTKPLYTSTDPVGKCGVCGSSVFPTHTNNVFYCTNCSVPRTTEQCRLYARALKYMSSKPML